MKIRLGTLRRLIIEQAWVPGRWYPSEGEYIDDEDLNRLGSSDGLDETDDRMVDDDKGPGIPDFDDKEELADHLEDDEMLALGENYKILHHELRQFFLQEDDKGGFYTPFDMTKDHTGTDDLSSTWYRSPGRSPGSDGDPFRSDDPHSQLGFHTPDNNATASPPSVSGKEGIAARDVPPIWQLSAGSNTAAVLGANAKSTNNGVPSENGQETSKETEEVESSDEASSEEQS